MTTRVTTTRYLLVQPYGHREREATIIESFAAIEDAFEALDLLAERLHQQGADLESRVRRRSCRCSLSSPLLFPCSSSFFHPPLFSVPFLPVFSSCFLCRRSLCVFHEQFFFSTLFFLPQPCPSFCPR
jgi:hypothetical protein